MNCPDKNCEQYKKNCEHFQSLSRSGFCHLKNKKVFVSEDYLVGEETSKGFSFAEHLRQI